MAYEIEIGRSAHNELKAIKPYYRRQIVDAIDEQLTDQPMLETRNRKPLPGAKPDFEHIPPLWELRVAGFRVFYDVESDESLVIVRAVREKPLHATTEELL